MSAQHTPGSIAALAEAAQMMPWDKAITDVPHSARWAFQNAITADHYLEVLDALRSACTVLALLGDEVRALGFEAHKVPVKVEAAIAKAIGSEL